MSTYPDSSTTSPQSTTEAARMLRAALAADDKARANHARDRAVDDLSILTDAELAILADRGGGQTRRDAAYVLHRHAVARGALVTARLAANRQAERAARGRVEWVEEL